MNQPFSEIFDSQSDSLITLPPAVNKLAVYDKTNLVQSNSVNYQGRFIMDDSWYAETDICTHVTKLFVTKISLCAYLKETLDNRLYWL